MTKTINTLRWIMKKNSTDSAGLEQIKWSPYWRHVCFLRSLCARWITLARALAKTVFGHLKWKYLIKLTWHNAMFFFLIKEPEGNEKSKTLRLLSTSDALKITSKTKNKYIKTVNCLLWFTVFIYLLFYSWSVFIGCG